MMQDASKKQEASSKQAAGAGGPEDVLPRQDFVA
jgi:hypothetical protein